MKFLYITVVQVLPGLILRIRSRCSCFWSFSTWDELLAEMREDVSISLEFFSEYVELRTMQMLFPFKSVCDNFVFLRPSAVVSL